MANAVERVSYSLTSERDLDALIERSGTAQAVLIGEATHGTAEFYEWRATITKRLIEEKGFSFVAVEGDWPDCYKINRYVKSYPDTEKNAYEALRAFNRWPTWMWANLEVLEFVKWLADHNKDLPDTGKVGFYGLDLYSLWKSLSAVVRYLEGVDPEAAQVAREAYRCFEPYRKDIQGCAWPSALVPQSCEAEVVRLLSTLEHFPPGGARIEAEEKFSAEQNAMVSVNAERYYRIMLRGGSTSWNLRDEHMTDTFLRLLDFYEQYGAPKGIVWAHNTHIGDARATDMAAIGEVSIGQLVRENLGRENTYLIGFGTHRGNVVAGSAWEAPMQTLELPPARSGSWEDIFHNFGEMDRVVLFPVGGHDEEFFASMKGHRAVGVVYNPDLELGNYVPTILSARYDAFLYIDTTSALHPLHVQPRREEPPATFPTAM